MRMSPSKYRNKITVIDGIRFQSLAEAARYQELTLLQCVGAISKLKMQTPFPVYINGALICHYYADFSYLEENKPELIAEDVKGVETAVFKLKWKLVKALYPKVDFRLLRARRKTWIRTSG